jgi:hypothetical protein
VTKNAAAPNSFRVKSPTLTASVRGTAFSVSHDPRTGVSIVDVRQDSVDVLPTKGSFSSPVPDGLHELILTAGKEVQVSATTESAVAAIGHAGTPAGAISRSAAIGLVERVVSPNVGACKLKATALSAAPATRGWTVSVSVSTTAGGGWATFTIRGPRIANKNTLATKIAHGCRRH